LGRRECGGGKQETESGTGQVANKFAGRKHVERGHKLVYYSV